MSKRVKVDIYITLIVDSKHNIKGNHTHWLILVNCSFMNIVLLRKNCLFANTPKTGRFAINAQRMLELFVEVAEIVLKLQSIVE